MIERQQAFHERRHSQWKGHYPQENSLSSVMAHVERCVVNLSAGIKYELIIRFNDLTRQLIDKQRQCWRHLITVTMTANTNIRAAFLLSSARAHSQRWEVPLSLSHRCLSFTVNNDRSMSLQYLRTTLRMWSSSTIPSHSPCTIPAGVEDYNCLCLLSYPSRMSFLSALPSTPGHTQQCTGQGEMSPSFNLLRSCCSGPTGLSIVSLPSCIISTYLTWSHFTVGIPR